MACTVDYRLPGVIDRWWWNRLPPYHHLFLSASPLDHSDYGRKGDVGQRALFAAAGYLSLQLKKDHKSIVIAEKGRRKLARLKAALRWRRGGVAHILRIFIIIFTQSDLYGTHRAQWPRNKGNKLGYIYKISTNLGKHNTRWYHMTIKR